MLLRKRSVINIYEPSTLQQLAKHLKKSTYSSPHHIWEGNGTEPTQLDGQRTPLELRSSNAAQE